MTRYAGRFNDGRTALSHEVTVRPSPAGLEIYDGAGLQIAGWRRADLSAETDATGGLRLLCSAAPDARLTITDGAALRALLPAAPRRRLWPWLAAAAGTVVAGLLLWFGLPAAARTIARVIPLSVEEKWGGRFADRLERQWGTCAAPQGRAALSLLTERLGASLPPEQRPRRVTVVDVDAANAIALPGGRIMIFKGLLAQAQSADEVAGVLAHEMTHVAERHVTAAMIRALGVGALVTLVTGDASGAIGTGVVVALAGAYSRDDEAAADQGAAYLLSRSGIGTHGMAEFFRRIATKDGSMPEWLSTHPDSLARARTIEALAPTTGIAALPSQRWDDLKAICKKEG